jgi:hypothetical protein
MIFDSPTARQDITGQRKRILAWGRTIGLGVAAYAILVQALAACAAQSLLDARQLSLDRSVWQSQDSGRLKDRDGTWLFAERLLYVDWIEERVVSS